jgi:glycosyltransferase involved in cell wall biosynthesis
MFTANSANELAQAVARLVEEPALGSRLARQARAWVVAYSYPERARRYHQFLVDTMTPTETLSK